MATETEKRRMSQAMALACSSVGGQTALARAIRRPEETVSDWANGKSLVDPERECHGRVERPLQSLCPGGASAISAQPPSLGRRVHRAMSGSW